MGETKTNFGSTLDAFNSSRRIGLTGVDTIADRREGHATEIMFMAESGEKQELECDHAKVLYIISKYARCAVTAQQREGWIRQIPLMVLIYEGVVSGVLDFDYAPGSRLVSAQGSSVRMWINISQEGKSCVDDLREWKLINGLKLSTEDFQPVTAFQVSVKGLKLLKQLPREWKNDVNSFLYPESAEKPSRKHLIQVSFHYVRAFGLRCCISTSKIVLYLNPCRTVPRALVDWTHSRWFRVGSTTIPRNTTTRRVCSHCPPRVATTETVS